MEEPKADFGAYDCHDTGGRILKSPMAWPSERTAVFGVRFGVSGAFPRCRRDVPLSSGDMVETRDRPISHR